MSLSIAFAQTTLALRDMLLVALRGDPGWRLTGSTPRVTTLPHGKPDKGIGDRLNLALVSAMPSTAIRNLPGPDERGATPPMFDLRYLITAHVFVQHHVELLIGMVLQTIAETPVLGVGPPVAAPADPTEAGLIVGTGRSSDILPRLTISDIAGMKLEPLRLPALIIDVSPVIAVEERASNPLIRVRSAL